MKELQCFIETLGSRKTHYSEREVERAHGAYGIIWDEWLMLLMFVLVRFYGESWRDRGFECGEGGL
jgi:hypothetical protein